MVLITIGIITIAFAIIVLSFGVYMFTEYEFCTGLLAIGLSVLLMFVGILSIVIFVEGARDTETDEYTSITEKLEANPFDEDVIKDAIEYNLKVNGAKEYDSYNLENSYEDYLNEPLIDINKFQVEYIDERYGLEDILESYLGKEKIIEAQETN